MALLNMFADKDRDLPPGWEAKLDRNGKVGNYSCLSLLGYKIHLNISYWSLVYSEMLK